jgi:hypothetical protein
MTEIIPPIKDSSMIECDLSHGESYVHVYFK